MDPKHVSNPKIISNSAKSSCQADSGRDGCCEDRGSIVPVLICDVLQQGDAPSALIN